MCIHTFFLFLQITRSDIISSHTTPWPISLELVIANGQFIFLRSLCIYIPVCAKKLEHSLPEVYHSAISTDNLTLTVLVATTDAQWDGMGHVGSARYELALLPPCPTIRVLSYSN